MAVSNDQQNQWRLWRANRDGFQSGAKSGAAKNGAAKEGENSFLDRPLLRAVEYLEKGAAK